MSKYEQSLAAVAGFVFRARMNHLRLIVPAILQSAERSEADHSSNYGLSVP